MKKSFFAFLICVCSYTGWTQSELVVKSNDRGLFINHTVAAKETFYSIGRMYNVSPKDIAPFNNFDLTAPLNIGQTIMIPLTATNFSQNVAKGAPVYYVVGEKEGLYRVSVNNGKVLMADLRKWNSLSSDNINPGQKLIVGYLNTDVAALPTAGSPTITDPAPREAPVQQPTASVPRKSEPDRIPPTSSTALPRQTAVVDGKGGYFKGAYDQQSRSTSQKKEQTATAGIFKTASGWQDAKYYALMDGVEPGTIVRVINPSNSKAVYAKVLGAMSGISQNKGLDVRISNAAANVLSVSDTDKFVVKVDY